MAKKSLYALPLVLGLAVSLLSGCVPAILVGGAAAGSGVVSEGGVGTSIDDSTIQLSVNNALLKEGVGLFHAVNVYVRGGRVMMTGSVKTEESRDMAGRVAEQTEGVVYVHNELRATDNAGVLSYGNDVVLSRSMKSRLLFDKYVFSVNYDIDVSTGTVYILGIAQDDAERTRVINHAKEMGGVKDVVAHIILADEMDRYSAR